VNEILDLYLETEIIFTATDGISWGTVADSVRGGVSKPGGALGLLGLEVPSALIITAWNPLGQEFPIDHNEALQGRLIRDIQSLGLKFTKVLGQEPGGGWKEESLMIPNEKSPETLQQVLLLADKYEQNAIFEITDTHKKVIGVRMGAISGQAKYRLLPLGTQGIISA